MKDDETRGSVEGVSLREFVELLVEAKTNVIKVQMAERLAAVQTAYERHEAEHVALGKDMEHLNQLRQEVTQDRERLTPVAAFTVFKDTTNGWMTLMGSQLSSLRGQIVGGAAVLTIVFAVVQIAIAIYGQ